jgi:hypothetical protein
LNLIVTQPPDAMALAEHTDTAPVAAGHEAMTAAQRMSVGHKLDRDGVAEIAPGVRLLRPLRDNKAQPETPTTGQLTRAELAAVRKALEPLAKIKAEQRDVDEKTRDARADPDRSRRAELPALADRAESLKQQHGDCRAAARIALLRADDAAVTRAAARYCAAANLVADAAAEYEALARSRDEWTGQNAFDPLATWQRFAELPAPLPQYLPKGTPIVANIHQRSCLWHAGSPLHAEKVRRAQQAFRSELTPLLHGAGWPF